MYTVYTYVYTYTHLYIHIHIHMCIHACYIFVCMYIYIELLVEGPHKPFYAWLFSLDFIYWYYTWGFRELKTLSESRSVILGGRGAVAQCLAPHLGRGFSMWHVLQPVLWARGLTIFFSNCTCKPVIIRIIFH